MNPNTSIEKQTEQFLKQININSLSNETPSQQDISQFFVKSQNKILRSYKKAPKEVIMNKNKECFTIVWQVLETDTIMKH
jgi:hypothetical protein